MKELRPIVETGYENILLVRLLIEEVRLGLGLRLRCVCFRLHRYGYIHVEVLHTCIPYCCKVALASHLFSCGKGKC